MPNPRHTPRDEPHFLIRTLAGAASAGSVIAPHAHSWPQLIFALHGVMTVWTERGSWIVPPNSAVWAPAGVRHGIRFAGPTDLRTLYVNPHTAHAKLPTATGVIAGSPLLRELVVRCTAIGMLDDRIPTHRAIALLVVLAFQYRDTPAFELPLPRSALMQRLVRVGDDDRPVLIPSQLARDAGMSVRTLQLFGTEGRMLRS